MKKLGLRVLAAYIAVVDQWIVMILVAIEAMGLGIYQGIAISISPQQSRLGKSAIYVQIPIQSVAIGDVRLPICWICEDVITFEFQLAPIPRPGVASPFLGMALKKGRSTWSQLQYIYII